MRTRSISEWAGLLRTTGAPSAPDAAVLREMLARCVDRGMDEAWFLAWRVMGGRPGEAEALAGLPDQGVQGRLWKACLDNSVDASAELARIDESPVQRGGADAGALLPQGLHRAIEVWTETELSCLHALWRAGVAHGKPQWQNRALDVARWHVTNLQPDNATNRPWAACLFAFLAARENDADAGLYAETLIHNCQVQNGKPDPLSALILIDSAEALERVAGS